MKVNLNVLFVIMGVLVIALISWNIYLLNVNTQLQNRVFEVEENFHYLDSYNKVIEYDLTTARDSVRILEQWIEADDNKLMIP
ncbi:MAG TPA: hypothetical protein VFD77_06245 [Brumimicrobium sp.]|nr:hypothetical protein [Brumimicrobium sp.]